MPATTSEKTLFVLETCSSRFVKVEAKDHPSALLAVQLLACGEFRDYKNTLYFNRACDSFYEFLRTRGRDE